MHPAILEKEDQDLPDHYGMTIVYHNGAEESFEVAQHNIIEKTQMLQLVTKADEWSLFPIQSFRRVFFDKRFSKIIALKEKRARETRAKQTQPNLVNEVKEYAEKNMAN